MFTFIGNPCANTDNGIYYPGFKQNGTVFSCLHYCRFTEPTSNLIFFGKINSVFQDKETDRAMAEVAVFQYVPVERRLIESDTYHELYLVLGDTMEIPISSIAATEVSIVHVPSNVINIESYIDQNIGKAEYSDGDESDGDSDDKDFIVRGDVFGFYKFCINTMTDKIDVAPPPKFVDAYLSFENASRSINHEFVELIFQEFIEPFMDCIPKNQFTNTNMFKKMLGNECTFQDSVPSTVFFNGVGVPCNKDETESMVGFVFLLQKMLSSPTMPSVLDLYKFVCLSQNPAGGPSRKRARVEEEEEEEEQEEEEEEEDEEEEEQEEAEELWDSAVSDTDSESSNISLYSDSSQ